MDYWAEIKGTQTSAWTTMIPRLEKQQRWVKFKYLDDYHDDHHLDDQDDYKKPQFNIYECICFDLDFWHGRTESTLGIHAFLEKESCTMCNFVATFETFQKCSQRIDWFSTFQTSDQNCGTKSLPILEEEEKVRKNSSNYFSQLNEILIVKVGKGEEGGRVIMNKLHRFLR